MPVPEHNIHLFPQNPYPAPVQHIAHRVWILDCRSCGMFLTNRGMKAVLLLRPNVSLYSSDALPVNCSAYTNEPPAQPRRDKPSPSGPARTCECLTQSLCCHGCGTTIGYMIVVPCPRCTSSVSASNRATNGHRFVFHSNEVVGSERHYVKGELGVVPFEPPASMAPYSYHHSHPSQTQYHHQHQHNSDYLPTPPLEFATPRFVVRQSLPSNPYTSSSPPPSPPPHPMSEYKEPPLLRGAALQHGDLVFWHHLSRSGEIAGVTHDERARNPQPVLGARERYPFFNR